MAKEKPATKLCKYCQTEIPYDAKVCPHCRKKVTGGKLKWILIPAAAIILIGAVAGGGESESGGDPLPTSETVQSTPDVQKDQDTQVIGADQDIQIMEEDQDTQVLDVTDDTFEITPLQFYDTLQHGENLSYTLNEKAVRFLKEHSELFPLADADESKLEELTDYGIEARHVEKNSDKFGDKLMSVPLVQIVQIDEEEIADSQYVSSLNVVDSNGQQYYVYYMGELEDIYSEDVVNIVGLPLGYSYFENTDGGQTFAVILAGCTVAKEDLYE